MVYVLILLCGIFEKINFMHKKLTKVKVLWYEAPKNGHKKHDLHSRITEGWLMMKNKENFLIGEAKTQKYNPKTKEYIFTRKNNNFLYIPVAAVVSVLLAL